MPIAPSDAAVAARSFPRRWRALLATVDPDDAGVLEREGTSSPSVLMLATRARDALAGTASRLGGAMAPNGGDVVDSLAAAADDLADRIEATDREHWHRDPGSLELLDRSIEEAAAALREAERVLDEVRGRPR